MTVIEKQGVKAFISYTHQDEYSAKWLDIELGRIGFEVFRDKKNLKRGDIQEM